MVLEAVPSPDCCREYSDRNMTQPPASTSVTMALKGVINHGVTQTASQPSVGLQDEVFNAVVRIAAQERLIGALAQSHVSGSLPLLPAQRYQLRNHHTTAQAHALALERQLVMISKAYEDAEIDFRVLKGMALAHLVYPDPSWRTFADVDILVPSHQLQAAVAIAMERFGGTQPVPELRPGFAQEFGKESMVRIGRTEIDLHRTFVAGPFGLSIPLDELFQDATTIEIGGRQMQALGRHHLFLHACYNVALGDHPVRRGSVRDLLLCHKELDGDLETVITIAKRWGGIAVLQRAGKLALEVAGIEGARGLEVLAQLAVPRHQAFLMRSYLAPGRSYTRQLASLAVIPGIGPRLRYARAMLLPSREYLNSRGWTTRSHVKRALVRLRHHD
ncbi:nucleotidyltransferase family protein [bacterium]|nr:nucleotidyltransferase family protein [bacterium]